MCAEKAMRVETVRMEAARFIAHYINRRAEADTNDRRGDDRSKDNDGSLASVTDQCSRDRFSLWFVEAHYAIHPDPCGGRRFRG